MLLCSFDFASVISQHLLLWIECVCFWVTTGIQHNNLEYLFFYSVCMSYGDIYNIHHQICRMLPSDTVSPSKPIMKSKFVTWSGKIIDFHNQSLSIPYPSGFYFFVGKKNPLIYSISLLKATELVKPYDNLRSRPICRYYDAGPVHLVEQKNTGFFPGHRRAESLRLCSSGRSILQSFFLPVAEVFSIGTFPTRYIRRNSIWSPTLPLFLACGSWIPCREVLSRTIRWTSTSRPTFTLFAAVN